jgi:hypothetical protein
LIFWKLLEKPFFGAPNTFWPLGKLNGFGNKFLGTLGDGELLIKGSPVVVLHKPPNDQNNLGDKAVAS